MTAFEQHRIEEFQSALPRGERHADDLGRDYVRDFNPRSREGSDKFHSIVTGNCLISIRAPARGATVFRNHHRHLDLFQSALPRGERLANTALMLKYRGISIRAPARGATVLLSASPSSTRYFNPRSREGSDADDQNTDTMGSISIRTSARGATLRYEDFVESS